MSDTPHFCSDCGWWWNPRRHLCSLQAALDRAERERDEARAEVERVRAAVNAARTYIHNSQDVGPESQRRYEAWLAARDDTIGDGW